MVDYFSKWSEAQALQDKCAQGEHILFTKLLADIFLYGTKYK